MLKVTSRIFFSFLKGSWSFKSGDWIKKKNLWLLFWDSRTLAMLTNCQKSDKIQGIFFFKTISLENDSISLNTVAFLKQACKMKPNAREPATLSPTNQVVTDTCRIRTLLLLSPFSLWLHQHPSSAHGNVGNSKHILSVHRSHLPEMT